MTCHWVAAVRSANAQQVTCRVPFQGDCSAVEGWELFYSEEEVR